MPSYNDVKLIGHLASDAKFRYTKDGTPVTNLTVAVNRPYKTDDVDFVDITVWNIGNYELAEYCKNYEKGQLVFIAGEIRQNKWKDDNGNNRSKLKVRANKVFNFSQSNKRSEAKEKVQENKVEDDDFEIPW